jgi:aromatic ring-opening dioxygenase catalytic subunit (LigB family)
VTSPKRWSTDAYLSVALLVLLASLGCLLYVHHHYTVAQAIYDAHANTVVFTPHGNAVARLNAYAHETDRWLHWQLFFSVLTLGALAGVLLQVFTRRNERLAAEAASDRADS